MRVTIISGESRVGVDGEFRIVDLTGLDTTIHAVQWDSVLGEGHVEYRGPNQPRNTVITDFVNFQVFLNRWNAAAPPPPPAEPPPGPDPGDELIAAISDAIKDEPPGSPVRRLGEAMLGLTGKAGRIAGRPV